MQAPDSPDVLPENLADLCTITYAALKRAKLPNHWEQDDTRAFDLGRTQQALEDASEALFQFMNIAKSYCGSPSATRGMAAMLDAEHPRIAAVSA